ncbi:MAG: ABC transporter ATP-binding protein [candidate division WOR-3 bacterium]
MKGALYKIVKKKLGKFLLAFVLLIFSTILTIPIPLLTREIVNFITGQEIKISFSFTFLVIFVVVLIIAKELLLFTSYKIFETENRKLIANLREFLFEIVQRNYEQFADYKPTRIFTYISSDCDRIQSFIYPSLVYFCRDLFTFMFSLIAGFYISGLLFLIPLTFVFVFLVLVKWVSRMIKELSMKTVEAHTEFVSRLTEYIRGMETFRVNLRENYAISKFSEFNKNFTSADIRRIRRIVTLNFPLALIFSGGYIITLGMGAVLVKSGSLQIGSLFAVLMVSGYLFESSRSFWDFVLHLKEFEVVLERIKDVLKVQKLVPNKGKQNLGEILEIMVSVDAFTYNDDNQELLKGINFVVKKGEILGIVGKNGAGKSTLIKIVLGLIGSEKNYVKVNGIPLGEYSIEDYFNKVAYLSQHPAVFRGTVKENILLGEEFPVHNEVGGLLVGIPMDHIIEEGGKNLSGGEKQKICLARVLSRKKDVYLLDEPTSHLDFKSIGVLERILREKSKDSIIIVVSHGADFIQKVSDKVVNISRVS